MALTRTKQTGLNLTPVTLTTTGNADNVDFSNASVVYLNNASLLTIRGLLAGLDGQEVTLISIGAGEVDLAHQNANSTAANRLINTLTTGITPLAAGGFARYRYDGTNARWRLVQHEQGQSLNWAPTFSGSGSMTWTSGLYDTLNFKVKGNQIFFSFYNLRATVGGTPGTAVKITLPNGYLGTNATNFQTQLAPVLHNDAGAGNVWGFTQIANGGSTLDFFKIGGGNWTAGLTQLFGSQFFTLQ